MHRVETLSCSRQGQEGGEEGGGRGGGRRLLTDGSLHLIDGNITLVRVEDFA